MNPAPWEFTNLAACVNVGIFDLREDASQVVLVPWGVFVLVRIDNKYGNIGVNRFDRRFSQNNCPWPLVQKNYFPVGWDDAAFTSVNRLLSE